jgi:hypothetical protein
MQEYTDYIDYWGGPLCEHHLMCPNKCYSYEYAYGYTTVQVTVNGQNIMFGWCYSDDKEIVKAETDSVDVVCALARSIRDADQAQRPQEPR